MRNESDKMVVEIIKFLKICQDSFSQEKINVKQYNVLVENKIQFLNHFLASDKDLVSEQSLKELKILLKIDKYICCFGNKICC